MLKIAICDDNTAWLEKYSVFLKQMAGKHNVEISISTYTSGEALLFAWEDEKKQSDVLYLDVHMSGMDGLETAIKLRSQGCMREIVFLTRDETRVYDALDAEPFHYIVKGVTDTQKIEKIFLRLAERLATKKKEYVTFSTAGENRNITLDSIRYFQVDVRIVTVYYGSDKSFEFYSTMDKIENALCSKGFTRIHRSVVVNNAYVASIRGGEVELVGGKKLPIGRVYRKKLKEQIVR